MLLGLNPGMNCKLMIGCFACCIGGMVPKGTAQTNPAPAVKLDVSADAVLNWDDPLGLTRQKYESVYNSYSKGNTPIYEQSESRSEGYAISAHSDSYEFNHTAFAGALKLSLFEVFWDEDRAKSLRFILLPGDKLTSQPDAVYALLAKHFGKQGEDGIVKSAIETIPVKQWLIAGWGVFARRDSQGRFSINVAPTGRGPARRETKRLIPANLDALLNLTDLWKWNQEDIQKNYVLKLEDQEKQQKPPQFEWVSSARDRARFSRHMFSDTETNLTMFGGSIKVEEAILEFVNGKAARATISFYNRGDSGDIEVKEFDRIFKAIGQNLSQVMKVGPKRQLMSSNAALPVTGWNWASPSGIALLEYNEYNTPGKVTKPEFLRLKLAAPNQADWSMGKMATGVQRMELLQRVKKTPEGDVYISGVPMVDQGQKGYCVAASCQRLFEYMRIPCDQHEMAKLVSVDSESGANIGTMQKSLAKIDGAFKVTFKPLVNPELYYANNGKRRVSEKEFLSIVKEYTDKGVPLLWGLMLGQKPEIPPLPNAGQISGGHMRMVIGYNLAKNQVIFTDSWGAGHELKRMAMLDAYDVTMGLYSMAPRGL